MLGPLNDRITEMNHKVNEALKSIYFISSQYDEILLKLRTIQEKKEINTKSKRLKSELLYTIANWMGALLGSGIRCWIPGKCGD